MNWSPINGGAAGQILNQVDRAHGFHPLYGNDGDGNV